MKLQNTLFIFLLFIVQYTFSQRSTDKVYSDLDTDIFAEDATGIIKNKSNFFWGNSFDYAVSEFTNVLWGTLNNKKQQQALDNSKMQSLAKLNIIKNQYVSYEKYPEKIIDGWHTVVCTDNINFCKDAKVFVQNNRIAKVVFDNYLPVRFKTVGEIKKAKSVVTVQNFNHEQLNVMEIYFLYDVEEQILVEEPLKPGIICIWANVKRFDDIVLNLDGIRQENFTRVLEPPVSCLQEGMIIRIVKPGVHNLFAQGRGSIEWKDNFEIKAGQCLVYRLGR